MYKLEILPIAKNDMDNIIYYISNHLQNPTAAKKIAQEFINQANSITQFPYQFSVYQPIGPLKYEYRNIKVKNFLIFYTINEKNKIITIVRVLYQKMDISKILE